MKSFLQKIGDYQILEKLGRGGMADVYLAVQTGNSRRIALKLVEMGPSEESHEIVGAERLGAELQRRLSMVDPRVPSIYACGELEGYLFIEMEFVEGSDLSTLIASGAIKPRDAAGIALELCGILRNAHSMSLQVDGRDLRAIVHGDIKPKNIRIDASGKVRILDFGIAKGLSVTRKLTGNVFGSAAYSSPERLDTGRIDEMSDLWALGVVLYEMVEGRLPYEASNTEGLEATIRSHAAIRPLGDACPFVLSQIIVKSLNRFPSARYQDAQSFESDLTAFLTGGETLASRENEETRRTSAAESGQENETKRTRVEAPLIEPPAQKAAISAEPVLENPKKSYPRAKKWLWIGGLGALLILGGWEFIGDRAAFRLRSELVEGRINADNAWDRYQRIRRRSPFGFARLILHNPLEKVLSERCEQICLEYRNSDVTRVREGDWIRCKKYMTRAIQLDRDNSKSRAMLEYAAGHIQRINRKDFDAVASFQRASASQPDWPDPYLGLARTYIHNLGEMERGTQALERARQLGISFGKRELSMMAEAYRKRGLQSLENASLVQGTDREKDSLKKAKSNFDEALKIYLQISPWGNSAKQIPLIQESLEEVDRKLAELEGDNFLKPWNWF